jgi:alkanesulfonate monooxygenase SsuD/methylene tetrahydromethanopterin reductase-like flavin-dependent oxidoreductase (luciferase family)
LDYGAHLPVIDFGNQRFSLERLCAYVQTASDLGFKAVSTNDHLISSRPWLDAPTALAAVPLSQRKHGGRNERESSGRACPIHLAKTLAAIDILSNGRLFVGVGSGSSARDYEIVTIDYEERWKRLDEAIQVLRSLWSVDGVSFTGRFYSTEGINLEPKPIQKSGPPIWIGSWGSDAGLRRVARLGDGWLASAYNTMPDQFKIGLDKLRDQLKNVGKDPASFPNALVTTFMYITDDKSEADRVLSETLAPMLKCPPEQLRERLLFGSPEICAEKLAAYKAVGVQRVFIWPVRDELDQLTVFQKKVASLVDR